MSLTQYTVPFKQRLAKLIHHPCFSLGLQGVLGLCLLLVVSQVFAEGVDLLAGTDADLKATLTGTFKKYLYWGEGIAAIAVLIKSRNVMACAGIIVVCLFFNTLLKLTGYA